MYYNNVVLGFHVCFVRGAHSANVFTYTKTSEPRLKYVAKSEHKNAKKIFLGNRTYFSFSLSGAWEVHSSPTEAISHYINKKTPTKHSSYYYGINGSDFFDKMREYASTLVHITC